MSRLTVIPVPCLSDNYAYLVYSEEGAGKCLLVDAPEAELIVLELERRGLELAGLLTTHHHWDHIGGNLEIAQRYGVPIWAHSSEKERIPGVSKLLEDGETFELAGVTVQTIHAPGHTKGALTYLMGECAFTGDTLFCGGCGRLKEGTADELFYSLTEIYRQLPDDTQIYCGHEYTESNLKFAERVQAHSALSARLLEVKARRERGEFCASASMGLERATNPFLRCHLPELQAAIARSEGAFASVDAAGAFAALRRMKDRG